MVRFHKTLSPSGERTLACGAGVVDSRETADSSSVLGMEDDGSAALAECLGDNHRVC